MRIKFIYGAVSRACIILCLMAVVAGPNPAKAMTRHKVAGSDACTFYRANNNSVTYRYTSTVFFNIKIYDPSPGRRHGYIWEQMLRMQKITPDCPTVQKKVEEFFHIAIQRNEKSCAKLKWSACGQYDIWAQNLYEAAVKNGNKSFASTIKKYSSYVRNDTKAKEAAKKKAAEEAAKKKAAKEAAKKKAAEEAAKKKAAEEAAKKKAAEAAIAKLDAEVAAYIAKEKADEAAKKKAAKEKAAAKQAAIDDAFSVFDITAKEAAAKIKAAKDKAAAQETKEDSSYILTSETLMEMVGPLLKKYPQLADIKNIKIKKLTGVTQYKTITKDGIVKTIRCNPCSYHSATLQGLRTGMDLGMPKDIFDAIYNAINDEFGGERPINKSDMRKLIISIWKNLENVMAKAMADPNFNIANAMTKEQIQQIKTQLRKTQANSNDNSGGSTAAGGVAADGAAEGHHEEGHHHHEEEDPGVAPGDPGDRYAS